MSIPAAAIRRACDLLDEGRGAAVLELLGEPPGDDLAATVLVLAARGRELEASGASDEAAAVFDRIYQLNPPVPAVIHQTARHYLGTRDYERAYRCLSLLSHLRPHAVQEFVAELPDAEALRYAPWAVPQLLGRRRPSFYGVQPVKAALARAFPRCTGAELFAELAGFDRGYVVQEMAIRSLRDVARERALTYEVLQARRPIRLPVPPFHGDRLRSNHPLDAHTRDFFFCVLPDAVVSSRSALVLLGDEALLDVQDDELRRVDLDLDLDPIVFAPQDGAAAIVNARPRDHQPLRRALSLTGVSANNFGHWLLEYLPKILGCAGRPGFESVPILIDAGMPRQHRQVLDAFLPPGHPIVVLERNEAVTVEELWACSAIAYLPLGPKPGHDPDDAVMTREDALVVDPEALAGMFSALPGPEALDPERPEPSRLYLARKDTQHRRMVNREGVEAWFRAEGFAVVDFGALDFAEQLRLTRGADVIVAADGSSAFMTFFARPGTRIGLLTNDFAEDCEWYSLVCQALDQRLLVLTGEIVEKHPDYRTFSSYRIDLDELGGFVEALEGSRRRPAWPRRLLGRIRPGSGPSAGSSSRPSPRPACAPSPPAS